MPEGPAGGVVRSYYPAGPRFAGRQVPTSGHCHTALGGIPATFWRFPVHRAVSPQAMGGGTQQGGPGTWIRAHAVTPSARSLSRENGVGRVGFSGRDGMDGW